MRTTKITLLGQEKDLTSYFNFDIYGFFNYLLSINEVLVLLIYLSLNKKSKIISKILNKEGFSKSNNNIKLLENVLQIV